MAGLDPAISASTPVIPATCYAVAISRRREAGIQLLATCRATQHRQIRLIRLHRAGGDESCGEVRGFSMLLQMSYDLRMQCRVLGAKLEAIRAKAELLSLEIYFIAKPQA